MHVEIIRDREAFFQLKDDWERLSASVDHCSIFMQWEYLQTCLEVGKPEKLFVVAVFNDGQLVAALPLYRDCLKLLGLIRYKVLRHIANIVNCTEYGDCLLHPRYMDSSLTQILAALKNFQQEWHLIWLPKLAVWNADVEMFVNAIRHHKGFWLKHRPKEFSVIKIDGDSECYLRTLSTKVRAQIRREQRDTFERNGLQLRKCDSPQEVQHFLDELFRLHQLRWSDRGQAGTFNRRPEEKRFYELFVPRALENGWLRLFLLIDGESAVAAKIGFTCGRICYSLQGGFDHRAVKGVGNALLFKVIRSSIEDDQVVEYDFLGGSSAHKSRWGAETRLGADYLIGRKCLKNALLQIADIWPHGRILH